MNSNALFAAALAATVWAADSGAATFDTIALSGDPTPGISGGTYNSFNKFDINNRGSVAFEANLFVGSAFVTVAAFTRSKLLLPPRARVPNTDWRFTSDVFFRHDHFYSDTGEIVFAGAFTGTDLPPRNRFGNFTNRRIVALSLIPDPVTGEIFELPFFENDGPYLPSINGAGTVTFRANGPLGSVVFPEAVFTENRGAVVLRGEPVPGIDGSVYSDFGDPIIGANGDLAFQGGIRPSGGYRTGIFTPSAPVAIEGGEAPGTAGAVFGVFNTVPFGLDEKGVAVFLASLVGDDMIPDFTRAIYAGDTLLAFGGMEAPGTGGEVFDAFPSASVNDHGDVFFSGSFEGSETTSIAEVIFGPDGLLLRRGDTLEVRPGDFREINGLEKVSASNIGLAFNAGFTDGSSGIFRIAFAPIPVSVPPMLPAMALAFGGLALIAGKRTRSPAR